MDIAIKKAKSSGVGWVAVKGSNHNGMLGYWTKIAADKGLIGFACTNTFPLMAPTRSKEAALGTNPLSVAAPGCDGEQFLLDMATTTVAVGKIEMQRRKGMPIPLGWAYGSDGNLTTDAEEAFKSHCLTPLGGQEANSGYKGYGLAAMVEVFCGISSGSKYGHHIQPMANTKDGPADLGHCFVVVDPCYFAPGFEGRMTDCIKHWRNLKPVHPMLIIMPKVPLFESLRFMVDCLKAVGTAAKPAKQQACMLLQADISGHHSHGLSRIEHYLDDIKAGNCLPNNEPEILKETVSTAWVDAKHVLGSTASHFCMDIAIKKAKASGVGWVTVKRSNHFGQTGYWASMAADAGLIGIVFTNTSPLMCPTRSKKSALGTNPIAVAARGCNDEKFYLDMATTAVALGKIEMAMRKKQPIPLGWAQDLDGMLTTDANKAFKAQCLTPLGGAENTSGFKGYGLAAVVELLCGISSGSNYGHHIRKWNAIEEGPANLAHCFIVVDPNCFAPGFEVRLADIMQHWRKLEPSDPKKPVMAVGDTEKENIRKTLKKGFVTYVEQQIESSFQLAKTLKVKPLKLMKESRTSHG